jgi:multidrug efflux pump subunit AcrA (membrane-fusion protein)
MKRWFIPALLLVLVAGGIFLYRYLNRPQGLMLTGIVTTNEVNVSPLIQGRVDRLLVREGDAGRPLFLSPHGTRRGRAGRAG